MEYIQHIINEMSPLLQEYGYFILALMVAIEGMGIPAPGQSLLIVASLVASQGQMSLPLVLLTGWGASLFGNTCGYMIGHKFSHIISSKNWIKEQRLQKINTFIEKYGLLGLVLSRFIEGVKQFMCLGCGIAKMPFKFFMLGNVLAVSIWIVCFGVLPAYFYHDLGAIIHFYHLHQQQSWAIVGSILLCLALFITWKNSTKK
ncbi:DedA family protein [Moritella sp. 28]|uniref:DedA family protein n=1 Tax=Moritella sp. 28 TaxID=2746232 RepID=UPI001BA674D1|nr:DedA family protein [Moritella sp. 28]QUM85788.1 DedA family protein [Moritella sp. 28]